MRRRNFLILIVILALLAVIPVSAYAIDEPEYHYIVEDAAMTLTGDVAGEIILPRSWYVKYLSDHASTDFKNVEYNGITGKVAKSMLSKKTTVTPSGDYYFTYTGALTKSTSAPLAIFTDLESLTSINLKETPSSIEFIAYSATERDYFLARVTKSNKEIIVGFVHKDAIAADPAIAVKESAESVNPDLTTGEDVLTPPVTDIETKSPTNDVLKIILITAVCILSVVVVFLIFKPTKGAKKRDDYYDRD